MKMPVEACTCYLNTILFACLHGYLFPMQIGRRALKPPLTHLKWELMFPFIHLSLLCSPESFLMVARQLL